MSKDTSIELPRVGDNQYTKVLSMPSLITIRSIPFPQPLPQILCHVPNRIPVSPLMNEGKSTIGIECFDCGSESSSLVCSGAAQIAAPPFRPALKSVCDRYLKTKGLIRNMDQLYSDGRV